MGEDGQSLERKQQPDDELLSRPGFANTGLGGKSRRSRIAHLARAQTRCRAPDHDGVRSRSRCAGRHRPMLPGRAMATRSADENEIEKLR